MPLLQALGAGRGRKYWHGKATAIGSNLLPDPERRRSWRGPARGTTLVAQADSREGGIHPTGAMQIPTGNVGYGGCAVTRQIRWLPMFTNGETAILFKSRNLPVANWQVFRICR